MLLLPYGIQFHTQIIYIITFRQIQTLIVYTFLYPFIFHMLNLLLRRGWATVSIQICSVGSNFVFLFQISPTDGNPSLIFWRCQFLYFPFDNCSIPTKHTHIWLCLLSINSEYLPFHRLFTFSWLIYIFKLVFWWKFWNNNAFMTFLNTAESMKIRWCLCQQRRTEIPWLYSLYKSVFYLSVYSGVFLGSEVEGFNVLFTIPNSQTQISRTKIKVHNYDGNRV